jgi:hypothetical protein
MTQESDDLGTEQTTKLPTLHCPNCDGVVLRDLVQDCTCDLVTEQPHQHDLDRFCPECKETFNIDDCKARFHNDKVAADPNVGYTLMTDGQTTHRAKYERGRNKELEHIRALDNRYRVSLARQPQARPEYLIPGPDEDRGDLDLDTRRLQRQDDLELCADRRVLKCAIEVYLVGYGDHYPGCAGLPSVTAEGLLDKATSTDVLISLLQQEDGLTEQYYGDS